MLKKTILQNWNLSKPSFTKTSEKGFSFLLHEYQGQALLKKYSVPIPKVLLIP